MTASEAANQALNFNSPLTVAAKTSDVYTEISAPMMVIQFAFANQPEDAQVILIPQETILPLVELVQGTRVDEIDENTVADIRGPLEAIVQGICLSIGNIKNETVVASGLSIRFQILSLPPNLQRNDEMVRTQVAIVGDDLSGTLIWLMSSETAHDMLGMQMVEAEEVISTFQPFNMAIPGLQGFGGGAAAGGAPAAPAKPHDEPSPLDLLMDIPLEISVELGRMKMMVKEIVDLGTGSIVELDKAAGEMVDVMVNGRLVARGEVVVIEDNFGVRITEILNPHDRLSRLGDAA